MAPSAICASFYIFPFNPNAIYCTPSVVNLHKKGLKIMFPMMENTTMHTRNQLLVIGLLIRLHEDIKRAMI